ncbi:hypothetical protein NDU88_005933 [Pleurodeles waltl]|uniref:Uncharacterized protein n=1 Tax=Pleurodeles waltl TaxID=8319 RepID=A0AAV7TCI0_PLEWA|nr:hypothetical protein NDU88_005933 [Pleurodeles waltl]
MYCCGGANAPMWPLNITIPPVWSGSRPYKRALARSEDAVLSRCPCVRTRIEPIGGFRPASLRREYASGNFLWNRPQSARRD